MIDAELFARIRRLFFAEHWKVGTIATELGVHHETVERAIEADRFVRAPRQIRPSLLDPYKAFRSVRRCSTRTRRSSARCSTSTPSCARPASSTCSAPAATRVATRR